MYSLITFSILSRKNNVVSGVTWPLTSLQYCGQELCVVEGHTRYVTSCAFSSDSRLLASGSNDKLVMIWKITTQEDCIGEFLNNYWGIIIWERVGELMLVDWGGGGDVCGLWVILAWFGAIMVMTQPCHNEPKVSSYPWWTLLTLTHKNDSLIIYTAEIFYFCAMQKYCTYIHC